MTRDDAVDLAKRVAKSWRGGPAFAEWCNHLEHGFDDPQLAAAALDGLREVEPLSFKAFGEKYRALARAAEPAPPAPTFERGPLVRDMTREQRLAILARNGAPRHMITREPGAGA